MADDQDLRSVADVMSYQCTSCGARDEAVLAVGPVAVVTGTEYHKLQSILIGELDVYRCTVCRQPTGFRPTVVIGIGDGGDHLVCLGELAISAPKLPVGNCLLDFQRRGRHRSWSRRSTSSVESLPNASAR